MEQNENLENKVLQDKLTRMKTISFAPIVGFCFGALVRSGTEYSAEGGVIFGVYAEGKLIYDAKNKDEIHKGTWAVINFEIGYFAGVAATEYVFNLLK